MTKAALKANIVQALFRRDMAKTSLPTKAGRPQPTGFIRGGASLFWATLFEYCTNMGILENIIIKTQN